MMNDHDANIHMSSAKALRIPAIDVVSQRRSVRVVTEAGGYSALSAKESIPNSFVSQTSVVFAISETAYAILSTTNTSYVLNRHVEDGDETRLLPPPNRRRHHKPSQSTLQNHCYRIITRRVRMDQRYNSNAQTLEKQGR